MDSSSPHGAPEAKPDYFRLLVSFIEYFRPYRVHAFWVFLCLLIEMAYSALVPLSFKFLMDRALLGGDRRTLVLVVGGLAAGVVVSAAAGLGRDRLFAQVESGVLSLIRARMFRHIQTLSMDFFARAEVGDVLSRFSIDLAAVEASMKTAIPLGVLPILESIFGTVLLFLLDWRLATLAMLAWPLSMLGPRIVAPSARIANHRRRAHEARTMTTIHEHVRAQSTIKAYGLERNFFTVFSQRNAELRQSSVQSSFLSALMERSAATGILALQVLLLGTGAFMAYNRLITIGTLAAFQGLFLQLTNSLSYVMEYTPALLNGLSGLERIHHLLEERVNVSDFESAKQAVTFRSRIEFRGVDFGYADGQMNLRHVTLVIPRGQKVAFAGKSGSGKSTMLNLLMRFYDPSSGVVALDGEDLRTISQGALRSLFGTVLQENFLFHATIRENIRIGKEGATEAEVETAAKAADIHDFIMTLPAKYDTVVGGNEGRVSGGQRQRIAIARAFVRDPAILIFDEATSALDPSTEASINTTLGEIAHRRTVVSVTHRLASITDYDLIYVFDGGEVVERGSHSELLALDGFYAAMWRKQAGFIVGDRGKPAGVSVERLRQLAIFEQLGDRLLAELAPQFVTETFFANRIIIAEGDPGDRFYILVRGRAEVTWKSTETAPARKPVLLEDGDCFGEMALLADAPRSATVRSLTDTTCLSLHRERFLAMLDKAPEVREKILLLAWARTSESAAAPAVPPLQSRAATAT